MGLGVGICEVAVRSIRGISGGGGDTTAPGQVTDLAILYGQGDGTVSFRCPGDDGFSGALPASYEVRVHTVAINSEARWSAATIVDGPDSPAAGHDWHVNTADQQVYIGWLPSDPVTYYVAIRFKDAAGNQGAISNSATYVGS